MVRTKKEKKAEEAAQKTESDSKTLKVQAGGIIKSSTASSNKKRTEKAISQFLTDILPALKKEMVKRKKESFSWEPYLPYFKADSGYIQTFILPLFRFLEKDEIICTRYGLFDNRHMVKTSAGFERVMLLSRHCDEEDFSSDVQQYLTKRFGKEWFKIPSKDGFRAKAAAASGHEGCFKVILTGLFEDSFQDVTTGETVYTINPSLMYEPCRPPPPKKEKKKKEDKVVSAVVEVGAQETPIELLADDNDNDDDDAEDEKESEEGEKE